MVILKDSKTGKYYIAPSPKSFYESKPSTSTGGSSGGVSSMDPNVNTNPEFDRKIDGAIVPGQKQLGQRLTPGQPSPDINKGYFGSNPNIQERGVLTVTKEEGARLQASGEAKPYWVVESETPRDAIEEGAFAGSTPQINRNLNTRSLYEYNFQNILAGKQTYKSYKDTVTEFKADPQSFEGRTGVTKTESEGAFTYQLTPEYFDKTIDYNKIQQDALVGAKTRFSNLPSSTRRRLNVVGYGQGVSSAVLGIGEFGGTLIVNMGQATSNEQGVFEKRSVKFGGTLGEIRNYPSTQSTVKF